MDVRLYILINSWIVQLLRLQEDASEKVFVSCVKAGNIAVNGGPQRMIGNYAVSFGGVGPSGMGAGFWGKEGLKEFSHRKHVMSAKKGFARRC